MSRFEMLRNAVGVLSDDDDSHWNKDGSPSVAAVEGISGFDDIGKTELSKFGRMRRRIATAEELERAAAPRPAPNTKVVEKAVRDVEAAARALDDARVAQVAADRAARVARAGLATALTEWSAAHPPMSDAEMRREFIRSNQVHLQAIKDGSVQAAPGPIPGPSQVDRVATFSAGARRGKSAGGGESFRRQATVVRGLRLPSAR